MPVLLKTALSVSPALRWITSRPMHGAVLGAAAGGVRGALQEQQPGGPGAMHRALGGAVQGAALGAGAAALGRGYRDTRLLNPGLSAGQAVGETVASVGRGVKHFGMRQLHGVTGQFADRAGEIGLRSSATSAKKVDLLNRRLGDSISHGDPLPPKTLTRHRASINELRQEGERGDAALKAGITSLRGVGRGIATAPVQTVKALGREMGSGGRAGLALSVGLPIATAAPDLARGDESSVGGRSLKQKAVGLGTGLAAGALTAGLPVIPQIAASTGLEAAGRRLVGGAKPRPVVYSPEAEA